MKRHSVTQDSSFSEFGMGMALPAKFLKHDEDEIKKCFGLVRNQILCGMGGLECFFNNMEKDSINKCLIRRDKSNLTLLHTAVDVGNNRAVEQLLNLGADVNSVGFLKKKPLHFAGHPDIAKLLIDNGANIDDKDELGDTVLCLAYLDDNLALAKFLLQNKADLSYVKKHHNLNPNCSEKQFLNILFGLEDSSDDDYLIT